MRALLQLTGLFLRLGCIAFGGPAAHIALFEEEVVTRRKWLDREQLLDLIAMTNLIPGPNSTEVAIHIGYVRAGWAGLIAAGLAFILPSALLTGLLGWIYVRFGDLPQLAPVLLGIEAAVLVIIAAALVKFFRQGITDRWRGLVFGLVLVMVFAGVHIVIALLAGGLLHLLIRAGLDRGRANCFAWLLPLAGVAAAPETVGAGLGALFLAFLKIGALLFGSGYVLVAFVQAEIVDAHGWLTAAQLADAIAAGQATPGPILCSATFIGYVIAGFPGAVVATAGIFLPSFFFVAVLGPLIPWLKKSKAFSAFLAGAVAGSVGLIAFALYLLGRAILIDWRAWLILCIAGAVRGWKPELNSVWLVAGGAVLGGLGSLVF